MYGAVVAALVGAAFYFMFFSAFHGFDFNVCLLPGGKDKLRGNTPSLPAAGSRFLIDAESGKKTNADCEGDGARSNAPSNPTAKYTCADRAWYILPILKNGVCIMNRIEITARLTKDPEVTFNSKNGRAVAKFSVAENVYDKREKATKPQFFNVIAFGKTAELIGDTLNKGNKIHIGGNVEIKQYEKEDGTKGIWVQILLREFEYCEKKEQQAQQPKQEAKKEQVA